VKTSPVCPPSSLQARDHALLSNHQHLSKFTVYESVLMALLSQRRVTLKFFSNAKKFFREEVWRILEDIGLADQANALGDSISHGIRSDWNWPSPWEPSLSCCCWMSLPAHVSEETEMTMSLIKKLSTERGLTILFTEHDMAVVFGIAKRISVLTRGP